MVLVGRYDGFQEEERKTPRQGGQELGVRRGFLGQREKQQGVNGLETQLEATLVEASRQSGVGITEVSPYSVQGLQWTRRQQTTWKRTSSNLALPPGVTRTGWIPSSPVLWSKKRRKV